MIEIEKLVDELKRNMSFTITGNKSFGEVLEKKFEEYLAAIRKIDSQEFHNKFRCENFSLEKFKTKAQDVCKNVEKCICKKKERFDNEAYVALKKLLISDIADKAVIDHAKEYVSHKKDFYRIVYIPKNKVKEGKNYAEHRPFEERFLIKEGRFSLPGFPCLYLGGSEEVCEKEVGKGNKGECKFVNQYQIRRGGRIKLLSLAPPINDSPKELLGFLVLYPLILASQSPKRHPEGVFHEEYIIPQLLMEYVREKRKDVDGIRYLSSHYTDGEMLKMMNYVLPVTEIKESGYDEKLMDKFAVELLEEKDV